MFVSNCGEVKKSLDLLFYYFDFVRALVRLYLTLILKLDKNLNWLDGIAQ